MRKELTLCHRCADLFRNAFKVTEETRVREKTACNQCGSKTYCSIYIIERKEKTDE